MIEEALLEEREDHNKALRPQTFIDYIGQRELINKLDVAITAANERNDALGHILLLGPPGLGKTSIANVIGNECNVNVRSVPAPSIKTTGDLLEVLTKIEERSILFIDEIHRLSAKIEESLYPAMEDFKVSHKLGNKEIFNINISPFCLIGATTAPRKAIGPAKRSIFY